MQLTVAQSNRARLTDVSELIVESQQGIIKWNLPSSIPDYVAWTPIPIEGEVVNPTSVERIYGLLAKWKDKDKYILAQLPIGLIMLPGGWKFPFTWECPGANENEYFYIELWTGELDGDYFYFLPPNRVVDEVSVFLGKSAFAFGDIIGLMLPIMMLGMIMPMMRDMGKKG